MEVFTYKDYINCIHTYRLNAILQFSDQETKYNLEDMRSKKEININNTIDNTIKKELENKEVVSQFINEFLDPKEKLKAKNIDRWIEMKKETSDENIIYKTKDNIFYLIKYKTSIDHNISFRLLNLFTDVMQSWLKTNKSKNINYCVRIVPIILYTGNKIWKTQTKHNNNEIKTSTYGKYNINLSYNLIDINKMSNQYLLNKNNIISDMLIIKKSKNEQELLENMVSILENKNEDKINELNKIMLLEKYIYENILMPDIRKEFTKSMIKMGINKNIIKEITDIEESQIEEIRRNIKIENHM